MDWPMFKIWQTIYFVVVFSTNIEKITGRKCICTSKACKEAGIDVCRTQFSCYIEEIHDVHGKFKESSSTRGCTEGATPLLCETNAWARTSKRGSTRLRGEEVAITEKQHEFMFWPRLKCCDTHDFCNSEVDEDPVEEDKLLSNSEDSDIETTEENSEMSFSRLEDRRDESIASLPATSIRDRAAGSARTILPDDSDRKRSYDPLGHRIGSLHVAALVLAVAALTSVLGACYVITRFLRSPPEIGGP